MLLNIIIALALTVYAVFNIAHAIVWSVRDFKNMTEGSTIAKLIFGLGYIIALVREKYYAQQILLGTIIFVAFTAYCVISAIKGNIGYTLCYAPFCLMALALALAGVGGAIEEKRKEKANKK